MALFVSTLWHANSAWYYISASLGLWVADRIMRSWSAYAEARIDSFEPLDVGGERVTALKYRMRKSRGGLLLPDKLGALESSMGQYAFLNVPAISILEWHPFTISSSPMDISTTHHIKSMGPGTFTDKLYDLARANQGVQI